MKRLRRILPILRQQQRAIMGGLTALLLLVWVLSALRYWQWQQKAEHLNHKVSHWVTLQEYANVSRDGLHTSEQEIEQVLRTQGKQFSLNAIQFTYQEQEKYWLLTIPAVNGGNLMRYLEQIEQLGLMLLELNLKKQSRDHNQVTGLAKVVWLWQDDNDLSRGNQNSLLKQ